MISILTSLIEILKTCLFFTTSYSNNVFPDPLTKEEEESCIKKLLLNKDKDARNMLIEHNWSFKEIGEFLFVWSQISD